MILGYILGVFSEGCQKTLERLPNIFGNFKLDAKGLLGLKHAEIVLKHERKITKHDAKLAVFSIFFRT